MPVARILIKSSRSFPAVTDADGNVIEEAAPYEEGARYNAPIKHARILIAVGAAVAEEIPPQDGLPRGCQDATKLLGELQALEPKAAAPTPAPTPIPDNLPLEVK